MRLFTGLFITLFISTQAHAWGSKPDSQLAELEAQCAELGMNNEYIAVNGEIKIYDFISIPDECFFEDPAKRSKCKATMYLRANLINTNISDPNQVVALSSGALERNDFTTLKQSMGNGKKISLCAKSQGIKDEKPQLYIDHPSIINQLIEGLSNE